MSSRFTSSQLVKGLFLSFEYHTAFIAASNLIIDFDLG